MAINLINSASTAAYQTRTPTNTFTTLTESFNYESNDNAIATGSGSQQPNESLMQNVLQSLDNLGLSTGTNGEVLTNNPQPAEKNAVLETFLQNLYKALSTNNSQNSTVVVSDDTSDVNSTTMSGGTNFKYMVDFSEASELGEFLPDVKANLKTAFENIGQYISSDVIFNLKVITKYTEDNNLAQAQTIMASATDGAEKDSLDTLFVSDSIHGVELSPDTPDSKLAINLAKIAEMSFTGVSDPEKFDFTSIVTHEILHGLAFIGTLGFEDYPLKTGYDELVTMKDDTPYFVGRHARTANEGASIPLSPASSGTGSAYYHVAIPSDLMAEGLKKGDVKPISALDIAMLQDVGISVTGATPNSLKLQNAYNNPSAKLQNLIGSLKQNEALKVDFDNLVQSLGGSASTANLHDFLTHLATNVENGTPLKNSVGTLLSVSA